MAEITAAMVRELRDRTGVAMMDCKTALAETAGDMEKAVDLLRKKGQAKQDKLASREAKEGRVGVALSQDARYGALVEINCNTDFTAKSDPVAAVAEAALKVLLANPAAAVAEDADVKTRITQAAQVTGENVRVGRTQILSNHTGRVGAYHHYTGKVGVLVSLDGPASDDLIKDLCLHITATRPIALDRASVPPEVVAREKDIATEQAKATGKPQNIAEKIAEGKMRTFYEERVLLDQKFVKDDSKTVAQLVQSAGCTLKAYARIEIGQ